MSATDSTRIAFAAVTEKNVEVFKVITEHTLPVRYAEKFYVDLLKTPADFTMLALMNDVCVGNIGCRLEARADGKQDLYVMTICVLTPYRRLSVGRKMLEQVLAKVEAKYPSVVRVYLHVQVSNTLALDFYKRFGFVSGGIIPDYYKRITPTEAELLEKFFHVDAAAAGAAVPVTSAAPLPVAVAPPAAPTAAP